MNTKPTSPLELLKAGTIIELSMAMVAWILIRVGGIDLGLNLLDFSPEKQLYIAQLGILGAGALTGLFFFFKLAFPSFQSHFLELAAIVKGVKVWLLLYMTMLSVVVAEILFRGAIQAYAGVLLTAAFYTMIAVGASLRCRSFAAYMILVALILGYMTEASGSVLPALFASGINHLVQLVPLVKSLKLSAQSKPVFPRD